MTFNKHVAAHVRDIPKSGIREFFDIVAQEKESNLPRRRRTLTSTRPGTFAKRSSIPSKMAVNAPYTSNLGLPELRSSICRYVNKHFGVAYDPRTEVIITVGVSEAIDLALRAMLQPGRRGALS